MVGRLSEGAIAVRRRLRAGLAGPGAVGLGAVRSGGGGEEPGAMGRERGRRRESGDGGTAGSFPSIIVRSWKSFSYRLLNMLYEFLFKDTKQNKLLIPPPPTHGHSPPLHSQPDFSRVVCFQPFHYQLVNPLPSVTPWVTGETTGWKEQGL